ASFGCPAAGERDRDSGDDGKGTGAGDPQHQPVKVRDSSCLGACGVERGVPDAAGRERKEQRGSDPGRPSQRDVAPSPACMCSSRGPGGEAIDRSARSVWTYVTSCQTWYSGILPRHEGMPLGRPSTIEVYMLPASLPYLQTSAISGGPIPPPPRAWQPLQLYHSYSRCPSVI